MPWIYQNKLFLDSDIENNIGFVYIIENLTNNKLYIGKKLFTSAAYKTVKGKRKKIRKTSNWKEYYSSSEELQNEVKKLGSEIFKREILKLCKSKGECSYWETKLIFEHDALLKPNYMNSWVSCKIHRKHLTGMQISDNIIKE